MRVVRDVFSTRVRARGDRRREAAPPRDELLRSAPRPSWSTASSSTRATSRCSSEFGIEDAFDATLSRRVDLPHGGYLMIDHAEALTVIDVNTGSYTGRGRGSLEDTIVKTNLQAAEEVVRQLRLRDIGGIIVIDFIDMAYTRNRDQVLERAAQGARRGPHAHARGRDLAARPGRDDAPERLRGRARDHEQDLPDLRRRGGRALGGDDRDRRRAQAAQAGEGVEVRRRSWCRCTRGSRRS